MNVIKPNQSEGRNEKIKIKKWVDFGPKKIGIHSLSYKHFMSAPPPQLNRTMTVLPPTFTSLSSALMLYVDDGYEIQRLLG